ncbi:MAG: hypothetical protein NZ920_04030 [Aigarchaeota archaeon]|nr:hypothetical protein [Aigarchaeota archaeon]MDW8092210.1 hypothetical protein [Nitrososphaerota archaeon]
MRTVLEELESEDLLVESEYIPICETTLMPVINEYNFLHHPSIRIGALKYIERAP